MVAYFINQNIPALHATTVKKEEPLSQSLCYRCKHAIFFLSFIISCEHHKCFINFRLHYQTDLWILQTTDFETYRFYKPIYSEFFLISQYSNRLNLYSLPPQKLHWCHLVLKTLEKLWLVQSYQNGFPPLQVPSDPILI